jgi:phosphoribosylamine--glycine ligase
MRVLLLDYYGTDGMLDFALRCVAHGHDVRWHFKRDERNARVGEGLLPKEVRVQEWREWMRWADVVVLADNTKYLAEVDHWRRRERIPVVGATADAAAWELDRKVGQGIFKKAGIDVPEFREFSDYDSAIAYVKKQGRAFVSKPSYDEVDKSLSYVGKSPADLVYMLSRWKKASKLKGSFILQEKVSGCEMAVGGWFGHHGFNEGWCENWEFKSLMAGDKGPNVGEMGTVVRYVRRSKLAEKVLKPLEDALSRVGYCGYVDVNCIIDEHGTPWPLEFTMRMGWPTFNIQQALNPGDPVEWLASLSEGRDARPWTYGLISTGVVLAIPQFPYGKTKPEDMIGVPITGVTGSNLPNIHPCGVMQGVAPQDVNGKVVEMPTWMTAADYVLVASGVGRTVRQSRARAYRILEEIKVPASPFWRPDIGQRLKAQLPEIQRRGFATGLIF